MKKQLIYQVQLGKDPLYDWCIDSVRRYCMRMDRVEHIVQTQPILKINPDWKVANRSKQSCDKFKCLPILEKHNALDLLREEYDQVLILDADIFIKSSAPTTIFDQLSDENDFGGVLECDMPITEEFRKKIFAYSCGQYGQLKNTPNWQFDSKYGFPFWNMGMMLLNASFKDKLFSSPQMTAKEFLTQKKFKDFIDGKGNWKWSTDQTLLNWIIRKEQLSTKNLNWKWNALYKGIKDSQLKSAHFIHFFLSSRTIKKEGKTFTTIETEIGETTK